MEKEFTISVTQTIKVTQQDIDDIMATALDSGISYWCRKVEVVGDYLGEYASDQISRGGTLFLYDAEDATIYFLTLDRFLYGLKRAIQDNLYADYDWHNGKEIDACNVDAEVADTIIQLAIFNDIVYG